MSLIVVTPSFGLDPRVYTFREVAVCYFPKVLPEVASRKLRRLIRGDRLIYKDLYQRGYRHRNRHLTFTQILLLEYHLGSPEEFITL